MLEDNFAVGGGKSPRQTKPFKSEHLPEYRPIKYLVDYITPTWENDRGVWLTGVDSVDHYYDSEVSSLADMSGEPVAGSESSIRASSSSGHQQAAKASAAPSRPDVSPTSEPPLLTQTAKAKPAPPTPAGEKWWEDHVCPASHKSCGDCGCSVCDSLLKLITASKEARVTPPAPIAKAPIVKTPPSAPPQRRW